MVQGYEVEMTLLTVINGGSTCRMNDRWSNEGGERVTSSSTVALKVYVVQQDLALKQG